MTQVSQIVAICLSNSRKALAMKTRVTAAAY